MTAPINKAAQLRRLLAEGTVVMPGAFNAVTARLVEEAGFDALYISGAGLANGVAAFPDVGLLTLSEVVQFARYIVDAVEIPTICDADTGFGEAVNIARCVQEFERAGLAGMHIEDQEFPKRCGHLPGKQLVSVEAMVEKIQTAATTRRDPNFLIIARCDARGVTNMSDAIARSQAYVDAGADAIFPEAMQSTEEFETFAQEVAPAFTSKQSTPLFLANMTEFGKSPYLSVEEFTEYGYRLVIFPLTCFRTMLKAVQDTLSTLKASGTQREILQNMMTRKQLYDLLRYQV